MAAKVWMPGCLVAAALGNSTNARTEQPLVGSQGSVSLPQRLKPRAKQVKLWKRLSHVG